MMSLDQHYGVLSSRHQWVTHMDEEEQVGGANTHANTQAPGGVGTAADAGHGMHTWAGTIGSV